MRYKANERRLELNTSGQDIEEIVIAVCSLFVPRYTRKLYFLPRSARTWPKLAELSKVCPGFTVLGPDNWPSNLIKSWRVTQDGDWLYVIPGQGPRLTKDDLQKLVPRLSTS